MYQHRLSFCDPPVFFLYIDHFISLRTRQSFARTTLAGKRSQMAILYDIYNIIEAFVVTVIDKMKYITVVPFSTAKEEEEERGEIEKRNGVRGRGRKHSGGWSSSRCERVLFFFLYIYYY